MASTIDAKTLNRIHAAIAAAGEVGVDSKSLSKNVGIHINTLRTACRDLVALGNIETRSVKSEATKRRKNLYVSIKPPVKLDDRQKLTAIAQLLFPLLTQRRQEWDEGAIQKAYQLAIDGN